MPAAGTTADGDVDRCYAYFAHIEAAASAAEARTASNDDSHDLASSHISLSHTHSTKQSSLNTSIMGPPAKKASTPARTRGAKAATTHKKPDKAKATPKKAAAAAAKKPAPAAKTKAAAAKSSKATPAAKKKAAPKKAEVPKPKGVVKKKGAVFCVCWSLGRARARLCLIA